MERITRLRLCCTTGIRFRLFCEEPCPGMAQTDVVVLVLVDVVEPVTDGALGQVIDWASFIDGCDLAALNRQLIDLELNLIPLCLDRRLGPGFAQFYDPVDAFIHRLEAGAGICCRIIIVG